MKTTGLAMALSLVLGVSAAQAQVVTSTSNTTTNTSAQTSASNEGVQLSNTFNTSAPTETKNTVKYEGMFGTNTSVGLGSYAGSFSPDYCGATAQGGFSVPYFTGAFGKPVLGEPGVPCVKLRTFERTMQASVSFGSAAAAVNGQDAEAKRYMAGMSQKLAIAGVNILCSIDPEITKAYRDAGIECPPSEKERAALTREDAVARGEPTDNLVRARAGLPLLPEVQ